jgi:hypothetical protein
MDALIAAGKWPRPTPGSRSSGSARGRPFSEGPGLGGDFICRVARDIAAATAGTNGAYIDSSLICRINLSDLRASI